MINLNTLNEKFAACWRFGLTLAFLFAGSVSMIQAQNCTEKTLVRYDMDDCESFGSNGSNQDFSEFDPAFPNSGDCINVNAANISNEMGAHSCVEGANGSTAGLCVEGEPGYSFVNDDDDAVRFSVTVDPGQAGWITELSFYQFSPFYYSHISGNTGSNKYLRKFGVRILKNGSQVYKSTGHSVNNHDWELATFDLSNDPDFEITTTTTFTFEILGYRPISSGTPRFFDVDDIKLKGCCQSAPCFANGGDNDDDGVCADEDCDDNNPNVPTTPGTACNDGNSNTVNDVIQSDGCTCAGTFDACANAGGDNDNDGVCADEDCDDNNPNVPTTPGTACNDGDSNTENDVIQNDGCTCEGTPIMTGPDCNDISITTEPGKIVVTGLDGAPITSLQIFNSSWQQQFSCFADCGAMQMVNLPSGDYYVYAKYYTSSYALICQETQTVTVTGGGCPDADNDGTCDADDCQPNNPAFPAAPGSSCDDGNSNTTNDTVTADGCGCEGTPISGCDNVNNGGQIGSDQTVCAGDAAATLTNVQSPSGGTGAIEYIWLSSTSGCPTNINQAISGATSATYNPGTLSQTTYFVRCSRRAGCSEWNVGESNCVTITIDNSPNCGGGTPDCNDISITTGNGSITVSGLDGAPITSLQIFTSSWQQEFSCFADCNATETVSGLANGDYYVYAKYYTSSYALICQEVQTVTVGGGGCNDADNDGTCDDDDCQPNNPAFPATPGSSCNDGNPNTENDTVTADGCGCEGTPIGTCDNVNNGGQIGFGSSCTASDEICGSSGDVANINSCQGASGGSGAIEYLWLKNSVDCNPPTVTVAQIQANPNASNWQIISGATSASYNPGTISTSTCYIRCARRAGCSDYLGESNIVSVTVDPNCGGGTPDCNDISISTGAGSITVSGLDGAPVTSLQIFNSAWGQEFSCFANCNATETVTLPNGTYQVYVKYYTAAYALVCQEVQSVTVGGGGCNDADNDGTCDDDDCQPNNPAFPATPGSSCDDGNPNTTNDVVGNDGCSCAGTPVGCDDADNDGTCDDDDCQPYNPAFPATPGSSCDDGNPNTTNDVVGNDGCSCAGTPTGPTPDCNDISITTEPGKIVVTGLDGAPITSLQIFNSSWQQEFSCFADCNAMEMVEVPAGDYYVYAKYYTENYSLICQVNPTVTITGGGCPDADNDGVCDADDCQPNNPAFPATPGTACNDGDSNTVNDVIQSDGCSCAGTFDACANAGGDNDNDGVCAAEDCDDNNPNLPAAPGTACNDGDSNTVNDVIQSDGCSCQGTIPTPDVCQTRSATNSKASCGTSSHYGFFADGLVYGISENDRYAISNGEWIEYDNGTATFTAIATNISHSNVKFDISVELSGRTLAAPSGSPKSSNCYSINTNDWYYYTALSGTLTGLNSLAGGLINIGLDNNIALQVGTGANLNDENIFGASSWLSYNVVSHPSASGVSFGNGVQMDFNIRLSGFGGDPCATGPCANAGGDNDNDGVCAAEDCDDNNPNLPATPGTSCDDGNPNTVNDVIQSDGCSCEGSAPVVSMETCGDNCFIYEGNVDYTAIGNSMNYSEARDNCNKKSSSSASLNVPSGSTIVSATLHWSGSGSLDNSVKLNGQNVYADETFTDYSTSWNFFGAYADVTSLVQNNGSYTVSGLSWSNSYSVCQANAAYGAWSLVVVYANANNDNCRVHVCQDIFDFTYPEGTYNGSLHCVEATPGCAPNAELTFITFESDGYKGEHLYIGGQYFGDNNFNGQTAPNLDIATFTLNNAFNANSSSLHYAIESYYANTIWGPATEGLFDFVKVLKYDVCNSSQNLVASLDNNMNFQVNQWEEHAEILWAHNEGHLVEHYVLERSADERTFEELETINSNGNAGMEDYISFDAAPLTGDNYYRIKMVNMDGSITYSTIEKVHFADLIDFTMFPNPANNFVKINLESIQGKAVDIYFYNNLGQRVKAIHLDEVYNKYYQIDTRELKEGYYNVSLQIPGRRAVTKSLMIGRV